MRSEARFAALLVLLGAIPAAPALGDLTVTWSSGNLAARATFSQRGGDNLTVTLENVSSFDVTCAEEVLTGVYFNVAGATLTRVRAVLPPGSVVLWPVSGDGTDSNGEIGGEYAYVDNLPCGPAEGAITAVGLDDFAGPDFLFPGEPLWGPPSDAPDGLGYGITSAGDNPATGNQKVTGAVPLVKNGVVFTLSGLPGGSELAQIISNVEFNYGTAFSPTPVPGAGALGLIGLGLVGWVGRKRRPGTLQPGRGLGNREAGPIGGRGRVV